MTEQQQPADPNIKPAKDKMKKESTDCPHLHESKKNKIKSYPGKSRDIGIKQSHHHQLRQVPGWQKLVSVGKSIQIKIDFVVLIDWSR